MSPSELKTRVTLAMCAATVAVALVAVFLTQASVGWGVLAGGALALVNFRWLAARAALAVTAGGERAGWLIGSLLRLALMAIVTALLLTTRTVHPVALLAGLTLLPCAVIAAGLRTARGER